MSDDARLRPLASRRQWLAPREIAIRDPWGVRWLRLSRRTQASALVLGLAALAWIGHASLTALSDDSTRLRGEIAALRADRDRAVAALDISEKQLALATLERDTAPAAADQSRLIGKARGLERELASAYLERNRLQESLQVADDRIAAMEKTVSGLRDVAAITGQQATRLKDRVATLELMQGELVDRLRPATKAEIALIETGLAPTRLDLQQLTATPDEGSGGPLLPAMDDLGPTVENAHLTELTASTARLDALRAAVATLPLALPVRPAGIEIRSNFGNRSDPINRRAAFHAGIDFGGAVGTPVFATAPGEVVSAGWAGAYGQMVRIRHAFGLETQYAHLSRISVKTGDRVDLGDTIGKLGTTGRSTGPHLHYEVRLDDAPRDPMRFIEAGRHVQQQTEHARDEAADQPPR